MSPAVFKCNPGSMEKALVEVYRFVDGLNDMSSPHFLIADRVGGEVVFGFRVKVESKFKERVLGGAR